MSPVIRVENLSKCYRLGSIGAATLREDVSRWIARRRGRPDPLLKIGESDQRSSRGDVLWALKDVSFEVNEGDILGIIGRNGAGKSTLLKILSRITAPTEGRVSMKGRVGSLLEVGTGFHPELTGRENIYLNGTLLGMNRSEVDRKLDEIVDFAEMAQFVDTPVKRYSSGMTVRLAFAVAAHLEPEILIFDEVLAVGDAAFQRKCLGKMKDVAGSGRTILFVSHNMASINALCDRGLLLQSGSVKAAGSIDSVLKEYLATSEGQSEYQRQGRAGLKPCIRTASLSQSAGSILVNMEIESGIAVSVSVDFRIADYQGIALGFASAGGLDSDGKVRLGIGVNRCAFELDVGNLLSGEYHLNLDITDPGVEYFDRVNECLRFEVAQSPRQAEQRLALQSWGHGSVAFGVRRVET